MWVFCVNLLNSRDFLCCYLCCCFLHAQSSSGKKCKKNTVKRAHTRLCTQKIRPKRPLWKVKRALYLNNLTQAHKSWGKVCTLCVLYAYTCLYAYTFTCAENTFKEPYINCTQVVRQDMYIYIYTYMCIHTYIYAYMHVWICKDIIVCR